MAVGDMMDTPLARLGSYFNSPITIEGLGKAGLQYGRGGFTEIPALGQARREEFNLSQQSAESTAALNILMALLGADMRQEQGQSRDYASGLGNISREALDAILGSLAGPMERLSGLVDQGGILSGGQIRDMASREAGQAKREVATAGANLAGNMASRGTYNPVAVMSAMSRARAGTHGQGARAASRLETENAASLPGLLGQQSGLASIMGQFRGMVPWEDHRKRVRKNPYGSSGLLPRIQENVGGLISQAARAPAPEPLRVS